MQPRTSCWSAERRLSPRRRRSESGRWERDRRSEGRVLGRMLEGRSSWCVNGWRGVAPRLIPSSPSSSSSSTESMSTRRNSSRTSRRQQPTPCILPLPTRPHPARHNAPWQQPSEGGEGRVDQRLLFARWRRGRGGCLGGGEEGQGVVVCREREEEVQRDEPDAEG